MKNTWKLGPSESTSRKLGWIFGAEMWPRKSRLHHGGPSNPSRSWYDQGCRIPVAPNSPKKYLWSRPNLGFLEGEPIRDDFHQQIVRPFLTVSQNVFRQGGSNSGMKMDELYYRYAAIPYNPWYSCSLHVPSVWCLKQIESEKQQITNRTLNG